MFSSGGLDGVNVVAVGGIMRLSLGLRNFPIGGFSTKDYGGLPTPVGIDEFPLGDNAIDVLFGFIFGRSTLCSEAFEVITCPTFFLGFFVLRPSISQI